MRQMLFAAAATRGAVAACRRSVTRRMRPPGAATGAVVGAGVGAVVGGPVGAVIGAGVGGTVGAGAGDTNRAPVEERRDRRRARACVRERDCVTNAAGTTVCREVRR